MALPLQYLHVFHHHKNFTQGNNWCAFNCWWIVGGAFDHSVFNINVAIEDVLAHQENWLTPLMSNRWHIGRSNYMGVIGGVPVQGTSALQGTGLFLQDALPDTCHLLIRKYTDDGYLHRVGHMHLSGIPESKTDGDDLDPIYWAFCELQLSFFVAPLLRYGMTFQAAYYNASTNSLTPWIHCSVVPRVFYLQRRRGSRVRPLIILPTLPP